RRLGVEEFFQQLVVLGLDAAAAGHAERGDLRVLELQLADVAEEGGVLRVGAGEAALDVIDAELVELLGDEKLVLEREVEPLALRAVAEGGVVDFDAACCVSHDAVPGHYRQMKNPAGSGRALVFS